MAAYPALVLQNHPDEGLGLLADALRRDGRGSVALQMWDGDRVPGTISGYSALIVLGGPQAAYDDTAHPFLGEEMRAIREAHATRTPILGICLGAQLMAKALGGRAFKGHALEMGWQPLTVTPDGRADKVLRHLPEGTWPFQWHGDTFDLPPGARRLAGSPTYANQAFVLPRDAYGFQFHLEWDLHILKAVTRAAEADLRAMGLPLDAVLAEAEKRQSQMEAAAAAVFDAFLADCGCHD